MEICNEHTLAGLAVGVIRDGSLAHVAGVGPAPGTNPRWRPLIGGELEIAVSRGRLVARVPSKLVRKGLRLDTGDPADPLAFELRLEDVALPVRFERAPNGRIASVRTGSTRGGFLELHRRPRSTSPLLWGRAGVGAAALGTGAALLRRRRR